MSITTRRYELQTADDARCIFVTRGLERLLPVFRVDECFTLAQRGSWTDPDYTLFSSPIQGIRRVDV
jgi:hypothetical protein